MDLDITLTPADYDVFKAIPSIWWDENAAGGEIAQRLQLKSGVVLRRISRFVSIGIVERRGGTTIAAKTEIRRVGK